MRLSYSIQITEIPEKAEIELSILERITRYLFLSSIVRATYEIYEY